MKNKFTVLFLITIILVISLVQTPAFAHRSGCHRWHSCPSDTGSYTCGDTGYCSQCPDNQYCKAGSPISITTNYSSSSSNSVTSSSSNSIPTPLLPETYSNAFKNSTVGQISHQLA